MKEITRFLLVVTATIGAPAVACAYDFFIEGGKRVGPITANSSEAELMDVFGSSNVALSEIYIGEGQSISGTVFFPETPEKRIEIIWTSSQTRTNPALIIIRGDQSQWRTRRGITLGTTLQQIEMLNGSPFDLFGFGWDYGGKISDFKGGKLESLKISVTLSPDPIWQSTPEYRAVLGDSVYSSSNPSMQKINPTIRSLQMGFSSK